jgi:hypothetical protein
MPFLLSNRAKGSQNVPIVLLINWLPFCHTCKMDELLSDFFRLDVVVRQGSILAPFCFAICINDTTVYRHTANDTFKLCTKCHLGDILVYADDILLIARSVTWLTEDALGY